MNRLRCIVPGCKRTHPPLANGDNEWMCQRHWATLPVVERRVYVRIRRRERQTQGHDHRLFKLRGWRIWRYLKRKAIERAMGL